MKTFKTYIYALTFLLMGVMAGCSEYEPSGLPERVDAPMASDLKASIANHDVVLSWTLPATSETISGVQILINGDNNATINLDGTPDTYTVVGRPMGVETIYTVKVKYEEGYISRGISVNATLPVEELAGVSNLKAATSGRTVSLSWDLPKGGDITGVRIVRNGDVASATLLEGAATSAELKGQPMGQKLEYAVSVMYDTYYPSTQSANVTVELPVIPTKTAFLLTAATPADLPDDDERAAAAWFAKQSDTEFVTPAQLADLDPEIYPVLWVMCDRVGLAAGWTNLPADFRSETTIAGLKKYSEAGGSLFLSNMATQLTVPLGIVPDNMAPTVFSSGDGGTGDDVWTINPYLGWDFREGSDQGFYDRTDHAIFKDLTLEDPNGYGYPSLPLIGPGQREDHNCLWDCNLYGKGSQPDVIRNFEVTTNSLVLATWGHVRDHCVAGLVLFNQTANHGRCVANGFAAYEWNQNSGANPYQHNVEQLTANILEYLQ